jgi:protein TonB
MPKPLVSNDPKPKDPSFSHFGVLDDGKRSKGAAITSTVINVLIILFLVAVSILVKTNPQLAAKITPLYTPPAEKKPPPPKPPPVKPPPELPKPPKIIEQPRKIDLPKPIVTPPDIKPMPTPVVKPVQLNTPAPKMVAAMAAPKVVSVNMPAHAASIANNDPHPTAVRAGFTQIKSLNGPAVAKVNIGGGVPGMPGSNTGNGPKSVGVNLGNGSPSGTATRGGGVVAVAGLKNGVTGGTGTGNRGPVSVGSLNTQVAQATPVARPVGPGPMAKPPVITSVPKAVRTADAIAAHVSGDVKVSVTLHANGSVTVGGVTAGLGHGLDQVARQVAAGIRFNPAKDAEGHPVDFPTVVTIHFLTND